jgi:hypothetical protein
MPEETTTPAETSDTPKVEEKSETKATDSKAEKTHTWDEVQEEIRKRLASQKTAIDAQLAKERKQQEDAALAQQGEYQKLAEERQQRIADLERLIEESGTVISQRDRYKGTLAKFLAKEREGLPAHILKLLDRMDEADQLEYIAENADDLKPHAADGSNANGAHVPPSPKATERGAISDAERQRRREQVARQVRAAL